MTDKSDFDADVPAVADAARAMLAALEEIAEIRERGDDPVGYANEVAREAIALAKAAGL